MATKIISSNYPSIPHVSFSNLGEGDHIMNAGQEIILLHENRPNDVVYASLKYDGANVGILKHNDKLFALQKAGYLASDSPYHHLQMFAKWVEANKDKYLAILKNGQRLVGEWLYKVHSTHYMILVDKGPIIFYDIFDDYNKNKQGQSYQMNVKEFINFCDKHSIPRVDFHIYTPRPRRYDTPMSHLKFLLHNHYAFFNLFPKPVKAEKGFTWQHEGLVLRLETDNKFNYAAKYVREDFVPGLYLTSNPELYNCELIL